MTIDEWIAEYRPMPHPLGEEHGFDVDGKACLIEAYETKALERVPHRQLWALVENDEGDMVIVAGMRKINVIGYLQTEESWEVGDEMTEPEALHEDSEPNHEDWEVECQDDES